MGLDFYRDFGKVNSSHHKNEIFYLISNQIKMSIETTRTTFALQNARLESELTRLENLLAERATASKIEVDIFTQKIKELHDQNAELENVNNELHVIIERLNNDSLNIQHRNKSLETKIVILYDDVKRLKSELLRKSSS